MSFSYPARAKRPLAYVKRCNIAFTFQSFLRQVQKINETNGWQINKQRRRPIRWACFIRRDQKAWVKHSLGENKGHEKAHGSILPNGLRIRFFLRFRGFSSKSIILGFTRTSSKQIKPAKSLLRRKKTWPSSPLCDKLKNPQDSHEADDIWSHAKKECVIKFSSWFGHFKPVNIRRKLYFAKMVRRPTLSNFAR